LGILSVDVDCVDYYILEALSDWHPSIIVVEYNEIFGWKLPVSVPYDSRFIRTQQHHSNQYWGANLPAFLHLLEPRGYALVGTNSAGSNAFFVKRELLNEMVPAVSLEACKRPAVFRDSRNAAGELTFLSGDDRARVISGMPLIDVRSGGQLTVASVIS
jgi:hypothetical protein